MSNVRQLGIKLATYVDSQKEYLPPVNDSSSGSISRRDSMWFGILDIPEKVLLGCGEAMPNTAATVFSEKIHYGMCDFSARGEFRRSPKLSAVTTPQNIIAFSDSSHPEDYNPWIILPGAGSRKPINQRAWIIGNASSGSFTRFRHGNKKEMVLFNNGKTTTPRKSQSRSSFAFIDGHTEILSPYEAYQPYNASNWSAWDNGGSALYWKHWINKMPAL